MAPSTFLIMRSKLLNLLNIHLEGYTENEMTSYDNKEEIEMVFELKEFLKQQIGPSYHGDWDMNDFKRWAKELIDMYVDMRDDCAGHVLYLLTHPDDERVSDPIVDLDGWQQYAEAVDVCMYFIHNGWIYDVEGK